MDTWHYLLSGLAFAISPHIVLYILFGAVAGMVIGMLPGLGASSGMALLLPVTIGLPPAAALGMLAALYYGCMYGHTVTSIVLSAPASGEVAATFDGYPLSKMGRTGPALVIQAVASGLGGTFGVIVLTIIAGTAVSLTQHVGPVEVFLIVCIGLCSIVLMLGDRWLYGIIACLAGFAMGTVGVDVTTGQQRFTYGQISLLNGVNFIAVVIGLFALSEVFHALYEGATIAASERGRAATKQREFWPTAQDWRETRGATLRGSIVGFLIGVLPGAGTTVAALLAYSVEKAASANPEKFGKGAIEGLAAPEAAHTSAVAGAMLPMLTLGIPGSAATAVLLGAFVIFGITPGPLLLTNNPDTAWGLIASMYVGNIILVVLSIVGIPAFMLIAKMPFRRLIPVILVFCVIGTYALNSSPFDLIVMLVAGILGFFMKLYGFPAAALVIALVLGPLAESTLRQSLIISGGSPAIFFNRTPSLIIICGGLVLAALMLIFRARTRRSLLKQKAIAEAGNTAG